MVFFPIDIDECALFGPCDQTCTNTEGFFSCGCEEGYTLESTTQCVGKLLCMFFMPREDSGTGMH